MEAFAGLRERILIGLESLRQVEYVPAEYLFFRTNLFRAQLTAYDHIPLDSSGLRLPVRPESLKLDPAVLACFFAQAAESLKPDQPMQEQWKKILDHPERQTNLVKAALFGPDLLALEKIAADTGADPEIILFFGRAAAAPFLSRMLWDAPESLAEPSAEARSCPDCGSAPGLSLLRGEVGQRFLVCSLCAREWEFPRLKCPFCAGQEKLDLIREENSSPRWIETCGACRQYLITTDTRTSAANHPLIPLLETVSNLYLDLIAQKQGCQPGASYLSLR